MPDQSPPVHKLDQSLSLEAVVAIARGRRGVALAPPALERLSSGHARLQAVIAGRRHV